MPKYLLLFLFISSLSLANQRTTTILADRALYEGNKIILIGHVDIANYMGKVQAEKATLYRDEEKKTDIDFPYVELENDVTAFLSNESFLLCHKVYIDAIALSSDFEGEKQITYCDLRGELLAEHGHVDYQKGEEGIVPEKIILTGNVKMRSTREKGISKALADRVEISPQEKKMVFFGEPVLFYDEGNTFQLSAKRVEAQQDLITGKERIVGFGEVRFTFADDELEKLKKAFAK